MSTRDTKLENMLDDPASVSSDAGSVSNRSIPDAIELDKHLTKKTSASAGTKFMGARFGVYRAPEHY